MYIIIEKDFGEIGVLGMFSNLTELEKGLDNIELYDDQYFENKPDYKTLVKLFKDRAKYNKMSTKEFVLEDSQNNSRIIKIQFVNKNINF